MKCRSIKYVYHINSGSGASFSEVLLSRSFRLSTKFVKIAQVLFSLSENFLLSAKIFNNFGLVPISGINRSSKKLMALTSTIFLPLKIRSD